MLFIMWELTYEHSGTLKGKAWKKIHYAKIAQNKQSKMFWVSMLILDKDFRTRKIMKDKGGPYIVMKKSPLQEDVTIPNI